MNDIPADSPLTRDEIEKMLIVAQALEQKVDALQVEVDQHKARADAADKHRIEVLRDFAATAGIDDTWAIDHLRKLVAIGHKHFIYAGPTEAYQGEVVCKMFLGDVP